MTQRFQLTHLLRGATRQPAEGGGTGKNFNSRTSCEVRRTNLPTRTNAIRFQLTHLLRGATGSGNAEIHVGDISTHAPLARCDLPVRIRYPVIPSHFNSRTSCEVRHAAHSDALQMLDFNSRTSCEVRHVGRRWNNDEREFQLTHLLRGATARTQTRCKAPLFQLTHLLRGATAAAGPLIIAL